MELRIEVICTGDEVLTGKIVNTNFSYISQKLEDFGLSVRWETTVGDDRESLLLAFQLAGQRADAVIVNGGLGPTVDDLSQEIAARAAGVDLVLSEEWLARMEEYFRRRNRTMAPNNRKQAMLPAGAEVLDNPVGTACGFAVNIGRARFYFTPGVPRELRRMLEEQIVPRLLAKSGMQTAIFLKRFHSYGIGESHADTLLAGVEALVPDGSVKLGFRAHYPQLETKLTARGKDMDDIRRKLAPVEQEVRRRLGNFVLAEGDQTLEQVVLEALASRHATLSLVETFTSGQMAARVGHLPGAEKVIRRGIVARDLAEVCAAVGLDPLPATDPLTRESAEIVARAIRRQTAATHALAVLIDIDEGPDRIDIGGTVCLAIATENDVASRRSRIVGGRDWVRLGAVEMGLDCLRRYLQGLPVRERIDFEKVDPPAETASAKR
ncbi:MAG TPA: CinA family nicotinamide mononucleotide deamidase-related protein [Burkholderiales bacterium]|nr:CinA family nicotinamide mononucleotide deamidase-related protein [Burkholderiales bacterium]